MPVPIYPPFRPDQIDEYAQRQRAILRNAGVQVLVTFADALRVAKLLLTAVPTLQHVVTADDLRRPGEAERIPAAHSDDPALIQYTSGSTGAPKGVLLSRPARWLLALHAYSGSVSAAPNFAFDLCVHKIADDEIQGLDLWRWRLAMNGSEAVNAETIERSIHRFAPFGFARSAMCPVYGLAETSVALIMSPLERAPRVDAVAGEPFERQRDVHPADPADSHALRFVSCGVPIPEHQIRIVDHMGRPLGERADGRIEFRGPSVTSGYFENPEATRAAMRDGWMDSGDLGYRADGELFITGRVKDIIVQAGRNRKSRKRPVARPASAKDASPPSVCRIPRAVPSV